MYRPHYIKIGKKGLDKALAIVDRHDKLGDIDDYGVTDQLGDGTVLLRLNLIVSDDLEVIKDEFRKNGIELF